jgi:hypothetical protein
MAKNDIASDRLGRNQSDHRTAKMKQRTPTHPEQSDENDAGADLCGRGHGDETEHGTQQSQAQRHDEIDPGNARRLSPVQQLGKCVPGHPPAILPARIERTERRAVTAIKVRSTDKHDLSGEQGLRQNVQHMRRKFRKGLGVFARGFSVQNDRNSSCIRLDA